ncbi:methionine--tRNA ligase [Mycoplasmoides pirum]|uniref:methionine--tRNA ligase n=1 Tax=Mycoplasmoides pirum TaxID=2122 RepID=UPI000565B599|nr:methionine--tRNA ligase [Mycoplasmoides pirum]
MNQKKLKSKSFITTPIFYPSGKPHIGHAFTTILADFLKRYRIQRGCDAFLLTGTDEHGKKIAEKAEKNNLKPIEFVDKNSEIFKNLFDKMQISYDRFVRTTEPNHEKAVKEIFLKLQKSNLIYFDKWEGLYCTDCEENYTLTQAKKYEDSEELFCNIGHTLVPIKENSYFVKFNKYDSWIKQSLIKYEINVFPLARISELLNNFLYSGLKDLSITRESISWGIKVPNDSKQTIYVWFDALFSYITGLNYLQKDDSLFQKYWMDDESEKIHLLSKEITRFHCIYWPIFLKMLDLKIPTLFLSHGWIVDENGNKMSKSLNNVIDPNEWIDKYGNDVLRYYLLKEMSLDQDNRCGEKFLIGVNNSELANNLGNLVSRTIGMLEKYQNSIIKPMADMTEIESEILNQIEDLPDWWDQCIMSNKYKLAFDECLKLVFNINKLIEVRKPWDLYKIHDMQPIANLLFLASATIRSIFVLLEPVLINKSYDVYKQMNFKKELTTLSSLKKTDLIVNLKVNKSVPIFARIDQSNTN